MTNTETQTRAITFVEVLPPYYGDETLPACPDGSGDLWWDDASYIRYQAWDGPTYRPESIVHHADSPNYCNGSVEPEKDPWVHGLSVSDGAPF